MIAESDVKAAVMRAVEAAFGSDDRTVPAESAALAAIHGLAVERDALADAARSFRGRLIGRTVSGWIRCDACRRILPPAAFEHGDGCPVDVVDRILGTETAGG